MVHSSAGKRSSVIQGVPPVDEQNRQRQWRSDSRDTGDPCRGQSHPRGSRLRLNEQATYTADEELTRASAHSQRALLVMATGSDESTTRRIRLHRSIHTLIKAASRIGEIA